MPVVTRQLHPCLHQLELVYKQKTTNININRNRVDFKKLIINRNRNQLLSSKLTNRNRFTIIFMIIL